MTTAPAASPLAAALERVREPAEVSSISPAAAHNYAAPALSLGRAGATIYSRRESGRSTSKGLSENRTLGQVIPIIKCTQKEIKNFVKTA